MSFLAGWIALAAGLLNLIRRKGTAGHRASGLFFVLSMCLVAMAGVAQAATGDIDLFAVTALASFAATMWAVLPFLRRPLGWVEQHATRMQVAFALLSVAAGDKIVAGTLAVHAPRVSAWGAQGATTLLIALVGWRLALRQRPEIREVARRYPPRASSTVPRG